ncbi:MAG: hypothetical protein JXQ85_13885 [Cognatishimia sp.]|uniref:hypothetical protein n=1 Tax=Cognatishimia sp. TaxID=2211648 RepID=UPI003B8C9874
MVLQPVHAENINTLSANANCDIVSIRQAERQALNDDPEKVDWFALDRKQREYTGKELLPEHEIKEPEFDSVTGCAIRNEGSDALKVSTESPAELTEIENMGWAKRAGDTGDNDQNETEDTGGAPAELHADQRQSLLERLGLGSSNLIVQILLTVFLAGSCITAAFGMKYLSKIVLGLIRRRRVCMIPVSVMSRGKEIKGHITILGLNCSRFVPDGKDECAYLSQLLNEPETHYFDLHVGELSVAVFLNGLNGHFTPCAFDKRLSVKLQRALLAHSTIEPKIGQLVSVPHDVKRHKKYVKERAKLFGPASATGQGAMA